MTDARISRPRAVVRATLATSVILAGTCVLAFGSADLLIEAARANGFGLTAVPFALTVAALVPPLSFAVLRTRYATNAGLRMLLGGLALTGASVAALWLTSSAIVSVASIPLPIGVTYVLGMSAIVASHVSVLLVPVFTGRMRTVVGQPSYRRTDEEHIHPSDGGTEDDDLEFLLDDEQ